MSIDSEGAEVSSAQGSLRLHFRDIVSHGGIFAVGLLLGRLTSVVLLPIYTRVLTPADYGVLAILDVIQELLRLAIGTGLISAASRFHFDTDNETARSRVWWVALIALVGLGSAAILPLLFLSSSVANITFGSEVVGGAGLYALMLSCLWLALPEDLLQTHLRATKRSGQLVGISLVRLFFNSALNVWLLYYFEWGVAGVLWGNLITAAIWVLVQLTLFVRIRGRVIVDWSLLPPMGRFGAPLIGVALLSLAMHQIDRYILVGFVSLSDIGVYSVAYQIGQGVNSLILSPFSQAWSVVVFEVTKLRDSKRVFAEIFSTFVRVLILVLLAAALGAKFVVSVLATPDYAFAADLIPVIAFSYFFFSLDEHFRVPAIINKRTAAMLPVYAIATALNIGLNFLLVPQWGVMGAAWAGVGTFAGFALAGFLIYRRIDKIDYALMDASVVVIAGVLAYVAHQAFFAATDTTVSLGVGALIWLAVAGGFSVRPLRAWRQSALEDSCGER